MLTCFSFRSYGVKTERASKWRIFIFFLYFFLSVFLLCIRISFFLV